MTATSGPEFLHGEIPEPFNIAEYFLDARAAQHPQRLAIAGEPREVTYGELAALANRVGNALLEQGVSRGDRVLIVLPDSAVHGSLFWRRENRRGGRAGESLRAGGRLHSLHRKQRATRRDCPLRNARRVLAGVERAPANADRRRGPGRDRNQRCDVCQVE